jgi:hypothetical protein
MLVLDFLSTYASGILMLRTQWPKFGSKEIKLTLCTL